MMITPEETREIYFDPELRHAPIFSQGPSKATLEFSALPEMRQGFTAMLPSMDEIINGRAVEYEDRWIPGPAGQPDILVTVIRPAGGVSGAGALLSIHGGGMMVGSRRQDAKNQVDYVLDFGIVCVAVEYRLAPENPDPAPSEDCYATFLWMAEHADELGIDPTRIIVGGDSAGGGLSAAVALMARDRQGPQLAGQMLMCPMLDDRNVTPSSYQIDGIGVWDRQANFTGWTALLGERRGAESGVSYYAAPARCPDLSGLPPAYIDVGAAEVFRDEDVAYATRIWATGGQAEIHVWSGCYHGFERFAPTARVSKAARATRWNWLDRIWNPPV